MKNGAAERARPLDGDDITLTRLVAAPASGADRYRVEVLRSELPTSVTSHLWVEARAEPAGCGCSTSGDGASSARLATLLAMLALCRRRARPGEALSRRAPPCAIASGRRAMQGPARVT